MGFLAGSLVLLIAGVLLNNGAASKAGAGEAALGSLLARFLSADVAGVPDRSATPKTVEPPKPPSLGGPNIPIPNL